MPADVELSALHFLLMLSWWILCFKCPKCSTSFNLLKMEQISPTSKDLKGTKIFHYWWIKLSYLIKLVKVSLGGTHKSIKAKVTQRCFHRTDKEINKEINENIEYGNTQQQEMKGGMAVQKGQTVESYRNSWEHSCLLISPLQKKKGRTEETHITVPPPTIY